MARELLLREILDPVSERAFFEEHWARTPLVLRRGNPAHFDGLFDLEDLEAYLFAVRPALGQVELFKGGPLPPAESLGELYGDANYGVQSIYNAMSDGYTIVLNAVHQRWPAVRRLVTDLEDHLRAVGQTNIYITGKSAQGFAPHIDNHDVFVLQTHGRKRWWIYDKRENHPGLAEPPLLHDIEVEKGDTIYIPQGYPHVAETSTEFSIHLAVGIFQYTWFKLFSDLLETAAGKEQSWHEPVPLAALDDSSYLPDMEDVTSRLMAGISKVDGMDGVIARYLGWLAASSRRKNPTPGGYLRSLHASGELTPDTVIVRRHGVGCTIDAGRRSAVIHFMGTSMTAPVTTAKALRFIAAEKSFRLGNLPGLSDNSRMVLVRRLIREGLLQLEEPGVEGGD
jgi:hypothetical protein